MIIVGMTTLNSTIDSGTFACPRCNSTQPFHVVGVNRWGTFFFIPVIPLGRKGVFVECQTCAGTYSTDVLARRDDAMSTFGGYSGPIPPTTMDPTARNAGPHSPVVYPTTSTMAVVSMALALFSPCLCYLGVLTSLTSIILGFVAEAFGESTEVGVGLKGVLLYGSVMTGEASADEPAYSGTAKDRLHPFFEPERHVEAVEAAEDQEGRAPVPDEPRDGISADDGAREPTADLPDAQPRNQP